MRSFLFKGASPQRFWNIDLQGNRYTVTYGVVGGKGRSQTKEFPDEAAARKKYDKLIAEKLATGYVEQTPAATLPPLAEQLERAILENPEDLAPYAALADFLMEQPDPALGGGRLFALGSLAHLRVLQVDHNWRYPLEVLADNPALVNLTHLLLHPKAEGAWSDDTPYIKLAGVRAVLRSPHLRRLTHLRLRMAEFGDAGCQEIVESGALRRLKVLDLRHGTITDEGARILARCPDVANLELLDLAGNELTRRGIRALRGVVRNLQADHQQGEGGDREYLRQGDYE